MSNIRNDILAAVKAKILQVPGGLYTADRVHIGPLDPSQVDALPHVVIITERTPGERLENQSKRFNMVLEIGVLFPQDLLSATEPDIQNNANYDPVHAKLEDLIDGVVGLFDSMDEDPAGRQDQIIPTQQPLRYTFCRWTIPYQRSLGATA